MKNTKAPPSSPPSNKPSHERITVSVREAAEMLGIGKNTMYEALHAGQVPCRRLGRRYIIFTQALHEWARGTSLEADVDPDRMVN